MAPPPPPPQLLLLAALAGLLGPSEVVAEPAEEAGARCPEGLWPLPPQVSPRVTYTRVSPRQFCSPEFPLYSLQAESRSSLLASPTASDTSAERQAEDVSFLYHPCAHPWLKLQLAFLAHICVAQPLLAPDSSLTQDRAPALAFTLRSWRPPGVEVASRGPTQLFPSGAKRRGLRAALGLQPTPSALRFRSVSPRSMEAKQPMLGPQGARDNAPSVPTGPLLLGGPGSNVSSRLEAQVPKGQSSPGVCACPSQASPAARAAAPPRAARGPTPRTEEAAWAAMALTFLLVLLTLATLCTRLHRNFRRGESIYWEPTVDSQDTVAAVLKRRLLMPPRRVKRSRRRPLLPPTPDSGPDGDSSE
ncbi:tumor protein p53-inducible protein 13 isoform X5 [Balaenoptera acutorostrata]|uniref:Tumor protein p53-inducible protein 13 isoform X5 n=1 Tax=Balaenoptera acutorostrata TaxID=9767 RepID=A0ABM3SQM1_BALAC|nr:tumor protein p53-inducible protein 13 isoform X5 [Balaenoptera acutorostrata]